MGIGTATYWPYFRGRLIFKGRNDSNLPCPEASYRTCIQFICQMHTVKVENRFCIECPVTNEEYITNSSVPIGLTAINRSLQNREK
ncbi:hypothetical protein T4B_4697 [Trichinella pseudospiralis]|uniref:Uncharacterized protein n=2 Tax=Trichinella pseudospiralis TaxID=6337 RepID=A0A0V1IJN9_TRIPS|nr:hypothetical protein T4B_4697 [Trichinella pseudospiralis]